ncbi:exopolysaccharide biosynthesis polyprenyl glycosylphosphotransferase [Methylocystis echinoides]|uniref:Bacterial sugar transferase domain-containing protein n=1 Tax=Methylocystis echinoides TaxID=29468 RepID=A0A9W6LS91_9HYPH|nr:exopolysaccharide biosynthesis polyprenyl glycosylphosphotransferase [Methylocystis echinoides]GLI93201.1 hypothetical protein LMG27198_21930 [Methylocystis echinoides]
MSQDVDFGGIFRDSRGAAPRRAHRETRAGGFLLRGGFPALAGAMDFFAAGAAAVVVQLVYHRAFYGWSGLSAANLQPTLIAASTFVLVNALRGDYAFAHYLRPRGHFRAIARIWPVVSLFALAVGFLARANDDVSRAAFLLAAVASLVALAAGRATLCAYVRAEAASGRAAARRVFLVGLEAELEAFSRRCQPATCDMTIVGSIVLRDDPETLEDDLTLAAATARMMRPDDIFILAPWSRTEVVEPCVKVFLRVPGRLHLGLGRLFDRFAEARVERSGAITSLNLSSHALGAYEVAAKRAFDIVVASLALLLLSPLLLLCAAAIRLESDGPALFRQRRYGFNREPFRIVKFRTMTTMEDGRQIRQATVDDPRVTRVGRVLRRLNIDELPQLLNVIRGDMSLVGPRPHALAHDQLFERRIALYARRHNVKPGITGWAQVNGLRGEIDTPAKIRRRVAHDLYYIDNWSLGFDVWILFLTVFSRKAYRNAV